MTENKDNILQLWSRHLLAGQLSVDEEVRLKDRLQSDPQLRAELLADETWHRLLLSIKEFENTASTFVEAVMSKCENSNGPGSSSYLFRLRQRPDDPGLLNLGSTRSNEREANSSSLPGTPGGTIKPFVRNRNCETRRSPVVFACVACATILVLVGTALGYLVYFKIANPVLVKEVPRSTTQDGDPLTQPVGYGYCATLTTNEQAVWRKTRMHGDRVGREMLDLMEGTAQLTLDCGAVINVVGAAQMMLVSEGELRLDLGSLVAVAPPDSARFRVHTPSSLIVNSGARFEVDVDNDGRTNILVRDGQVTVASSKKEVGKSECWQLAHDELNHATFYARTGHAEANAVAAKAHGSKGQFKGMIRFNGQTVCFLSAAVFEKTYDCVKAIVAEDSESIVKAWSDFAETFSARSFSGLIEINGIRHEFDSPEEAMWIRQKPLVQPGGAPRRPANSVRNFSGTICVNGKSRSFNSKAEYDAARKQAFGKGATFGLGELSF